MSFLHSRIVGITGGAQGIGKAIGAKLLQMGVKKVYIADINGCEGWKTEKEFKTKYGIQRAEFIETDVTKCDSFECFFKQISKCGGMDILINQASVFEQPHVLDVNLNGVLRGMNLAHKYMSRENGYTGGTVINMGCICSFIGFVALPKYTASKHGVIGITRVYSHQLYHKSGINVMAVCPGLVKGDLYTDELPGYLKDEFQEECREQKLKEQDPVVVADAVVLALRTDENGSIWICEENDIYIIDLPKVQNIIRPVPEYPVPREWATTVIEN